MALELNEKLQEFNIEIIQRIAEYDQKLNYFKTQGLNRNQVFIDQLSPKLQKILREDLNCAYNQVMSIEEMTPEKNERFNKLMSYYFEWVAPRS